MDTAADTMDAYIQAPVLGALACRCLHMSNPSATPTGFAGLGFMKRRSNEDLHGGIGSGLSASMLGKFTVRKSIWPAAKIGESLSSDFVSRSWMRYWRLSRKPH